MLIYHKEKTDTEALTALYLSLNITLFCFPAMSEYTELSYVLDSYCIKVEIILFLSDRSLLYRKPSARKFFISSGSQTLFSAINRTISPRAIFARVAFCFTFPSLSWPNSTVRNRSFGSRYFSTAFEYSLEARFIIRRSPSVSSLYSRSPQKSYRSFFPFTDNLAYISRR